MLNLLERSRKVISPRTEMHAGQHDLFGAASQRGLNIENHIRHRAAATFAARNGRDAERAVIVTAILHLDEGARAAMQAGQRLAGNRFEVKRFRLEGSIHPRPDDLFGHSRPPAAHSADRAPAAAGALPSSLLRRSHSPPPARSDGSCRANPTAASLVTAQVLTTAISAVSAEVTISCPAARNLPRHRFDLALIQPAADGVEVDFHSRSSKVSQTLASRLR